MNQIESLVSALKHGEMSMKDLLSQIENLNVSRLTSNDMDSRHSRKSLSENEGGMELFNGYADGRMMMIGSEIDNITNQSYVI